MYLNCFSDFAPFLVRTLEPYHHSSSDSSSTHLAFDADQLVLFISKHASGWWDGELLNGRRGWFPRHYVEVVSAEKASEEGRGVEEGGDAADDC